MAEVMSLVFMVFMVIPVIAPGVGQLIMLFAEWHMIFVFMARDRAGDHASGPRCGCRKRMHPGVPPAVRRSRSIVGGFRHRAHEPRVAVATRWRPPSVFGALFGFINSAQQIYVGIYGLGVWFPVALRRASPA